jgi:hypothetical protein
MRKPVNTPRNCGIESLMLYGNSMKNNEEKI